MRRGAGRHARGLARRDRGRRRRVDRRALCAWAAQVLAAAALLLAALGTFASWAWGVLRFLGLARGGVPVPRGFPAYSLADAAALRAEALCGRGYGGCVLALLVLFLVLVLAASVLLNRLAAIRGILDRAC